VGGLPEIRGCSMRIRLPREWMDSGGKGIGHAWAEKPNGCGQLIVNALAITAEHWAKSST